MQALNTVIQDRHNHIEFSTAVKVFGRTQKLEIHLANEGSALAFFSTRKGWTFGNNVGNDFRVLIRRKGLHMSVFAYDFVRIHSLTIYTVLNEHNIAGDTKTPLQRCFLFSTKLKNGDFKNTGQYMNYETFCNQQFEPLLKSSLSSQSSSSSHNFEKTSCE